MIKISFDDNTRSMCFNNGTKIANVINRMFECYSSDEFATLDNGTACKNAYGELKQGDMCMVVGSAVAYYVWNGTAWISM